jgi:hypothetical protein
MSGSGSTLFFDTGAQGAPAGRFRRRPGAYVPTGGSQQHEPSPDPGGAPSFSRRDVTGHAVAVPPSARDGAAPCHLGEQRSAAGELWRWRSCMTKRASRASCAGVALLAAEREVLFGKRPASLG